VAEEREMADFDLLVRGGTVVDGTGAPRCVGDVGVRGGRIAAVGRLSGSAGCMIDASGAVVAPGFIDIHTHYDAQVLWDRMVTISPWHGVTTVVIGNCGFGVAPTRSEHRDLILRTLENVEGMSLDALRAGVGEEWPFETFPEFLDAVDRRGSVINVAALVGHTPVRTYVMGEEATQREATAAEIAEMRALVADALRAGAVGFATSKAPTHVGYDGLPVPSRHASLAEIEALAASLGDVGHGVFQATVGAGFFIDELAKIQQATRRPVSWTALLGGMLGPDGHRGILEKSADLQARGIAVIPQVSCRPLVVEFQMSAPFPLATLSAMKPAFAADAEGKQRLYRDPDFRDALRGTIDGGLFTRGFREMRVSDAPGHPELVERTVGEIAAERNVHHVDAVLDLALATGLEARFRLAVLNTDEQVVGELLRHPATILGLSDAGAHASQLCDAGAPTDLLGRWVRDKGVLELEAGVRALTGKPAELFGFRDRGRIAEGLVADLTVFDPATVGCGQLRRVRDLPAGADRLVADASGIRAVVVAGVLVREEGRDAVDPEGVLPGRVVRGGAS
jgi:N-acyl-D-aspartate/D-glutamate deacylase